MKVKEFLYKYPFIAYLLLAAIIFWPISLGVYALQYDAIDVYLPWRFYGSESIRQGIVPLWNPYQNGGYPFFADLQYSIWNPELFIVSLFGRYNAGTIQFLYILYLVIGGLGFKYLLSQFNLEKKAAFFGGILFMFSGMLIGHAQSIVSVLGAIWLPWVIGSYMSVLNNNFSFKTIISFILFTFLMLSGGYQAVSIMLFYVLLVFAIYRFIVLVKQKNNSLIKRFFIGHFITIITLGILMLGTIISLIDVFPHLSRLSGVSIEETQRFIMHPKAIISALFPLAAVQIKVPHMDISFQNIFNGTCIFFLLFYGFKNYKRFNSPYLFILGIFGFIYGLASLGYFTPIQPFLAKNLPGFNLFFYPIFYRYFIWIFLLIVASYGLQYFYENKKNKHFLYFLIILLLTFISAIVFTSSSISELSELTFSNRIDSLRNLSFNSAVLFQSIIHCSMVIIFIVLYFIIRKKSILIYLFLIAELALISQLNIPITVHGKTTTAEINHYLKMKGEGFPIPSNNLTMKDYENEGKEGGIWRNQGNFTNLPNLTGFTSFRLNNRENVSDNHPEIEAFINTKPLVYLNQDNGKINIESFSPNYFSINIQSSSTDSLIIQQTNYDGWTAKVNGNDTKISTANGFEMKIPLSKGENKVTLQFNKPLVSFLFYLTHIGFIILVLIYFFIQSTINTTFKYGVIILALTFTVSKLLYYNFSENTAGKHILQIEGKESLTIPSNLDQKTKEAILNQTILSNSKEISLINDGADFNPELISLAVYNYSPKSNISLNDDKILFTNKNQQNTPQSPILSVDNNNPFHNALVLNELNNINPKNTYLLAFGLNIKSDSIPENLFVVTDIQRDEKSVLYKAIPIKKYTLKNNSSYFINGFILPPLQKSDKLIVYMWNNSSKSFSFSNFKADILTLED